MVPNMLPPGDVAYKVITVEPLNKGHIGDNNIIINSLVLSFVERLSSSMGCICIEL